MDVASASGEYTPGICFELKSGLIVLQMRTPTLEFRCWCYPFFRKYIWTDIRSWIVYVRILAYVFSIQQGDSSGSWFSWNFHRCSVFLNVQNVTAKTELSRLRCRKYSFENILRVNQAIARVSQDVNFHRRPAPNFPSRLPVKSVPLTHVESFHGHNPLQARFECSIKVNLRYRGESDSIKIKIR